MDKVKVANRPLGPFPVVIVGADVDGRANYATVGACGVVSLDPVLHVSLRRTHHTSRGVRENGCFSVNLPSSDLVARTDYCGSVSGATVDKSPVFTAFYDELGRAPLIAECPMNLLCRVFRTVPVFDFEMFLGEIVAAYVGGQYLTDGEPDPAKIAPLLIMGTGYWKLGAAAGTIFREAPGYRG